MGGSEYIPPGSGGGGTGPQGPQGAQGSTGATGAQGSQGAQGPQGSSGGGGGAAGVLDLGTVGLGTTTVASGSNGGNIANIASWSSPGPGELAVSSEATVSPSNVSASNPGNVLVVTSAGVAVVAYTGVNSGSNYLTGCTLLSGSGTVSTGANVTCSIPALPGGTVNLTVTSNTPASLYVPSAASLNGSGMTVQLSTPAGPYIYSEPEIIGFPGDTFTWLTNQQWFQTAGQNNLFFIQGLNTTAQGGTPTTMAIPGTSQGGPAASLFPAIYSATSGASFNLPDPVATGFQIVELTLTANCTLFEPLLTGVPSGQGKRLEVKLIQGSGGPYTVTWDGAFDWPADTPPVLSTIVGNYDRILLTEDYNLTAWSGSIIGLNYTQSSLITEVAQNAAGFSTTTSATVTLTLQKVGDLVVYQNASASGHTVSGVATSGTGATGAWTKAGALASGSSDSELWYAYVTTVGACTITGTMTGSSSGGNSANEFQAKAGTISIDQTSNGTAQTASPFNLPTLTAEGLYVCAFYGTGTAGNVSASTSGYTIYPTGGTPDGICYATGVAGSQTPQCTAAGTVNASNPVLVPAASFQVT